MTLNAILKKILQIPVGLFVSLPIVAPILRAIAKLLPIPDSAAQRLPIVGQFYFQISGTESVYISSLYDNVGRILFWRGFENYERETMHVFQRVVRNAGTFVDIGANTGIFTIAGKTFNPNLSIHAFEPVPDIFEKLKSILVLNNIQHDVFALQVAISNIRGRTAFHIPEDNMSSASLNMDGAHHLHGHVVSVESVTLDGYAKENKLSRIDVIKIDVEGFEDRVLDGAQMILKRDRPAIICECLPECNVSVIETILNGAGYSFYMLTEKGPIKMSRIEPDVNMIFKNYLFVPDGLEVGGDGI